MKRLHAEVIAHWEENIVVEEWFKGDTFEEVADQVEEWAQEQADRIYSAIIAEFNS